MGKYRVTKTAMKEKWKSKLFFVPDGSMQIFKRVIEPVAYSTRVEGWACDYYEFSNFCICEGYAPIGKRIMSYEEFQPFRKAYDEVKARYLPGEEETKIIQNILDDFIGTVKVKAKI